ncbi:MAG: hypothetical protein Q9161_000514 [Pseudevernia consocians]
MAKLVLHLPSEILGNVFSLSSSKDLRQARLVSRVFCTVSSVYLFKYQRFDMNAKEKTKLSCILATSQVADNVQELEIIGPRRPSDLEYKLPQRVRTVLDNLCKLEYLSTLTVRFEEDPVYLTPTDSKTRVDYRGDLLASIITSLPNSVSINNRVLHLCISNLQSRIAPSITKSVGFVDLLRNLRTLKLKIQDTEKSHEEPYLDDNRIEDSVSFYNVLPQTWLQPTCQNLESLYLSADLNWGWYPKVDFRHTRFPHLRSLALANFTFSHDWQLAWLLSHAESLRSLVLLSCKILTFADTTPHRLDSDGYLETANTDISAPFGTQVRFEGRLCQYFREFASALPRLQLFSIRKLNDNDHVHWQDTKVNAPAECRRDVQISLGHCFCYEVYISEEYHSYRWQNPDVSDNKEARDKWQERCGLQYDEDWKALSELLDIIEERNRARP